MTINVTDTVGANNTIVLDGSSKIPAFDGSLVTALDADVFTTGSLATARIDVGTTAGKILQLDSNAKYPAVSGANLLNVPGPTISTSDPAIDTNLTLGAKWINKTSGEVYVCTDATAGANVWVNVGAGSGDIQPYSFQGSNYGYFYGGTGAPTNKIDRVSFTSDGNATDVGDMLTGRNTYAGQSSTTHGYVSGGIPTPSNAIEKFQFTAANGFTMTDVANLTVGRNYISGHSSQTYGFVSGGGAPPGQDIIDKFPFATDSDATDVGNLTVARGGWSGTNSLTHGYTAGGWAGGPLTNIIDKFSMVSDGNATDVGDILVATSQTSGASSLTYGYNVGDYQPALTNVIQKYSFSADANSTDVGNLTGVVFTSGGCSATAYGYRGGGATAGSGGGATDIIDKWSFVSDADATDVGNLTHARTYMGYGSQY